ncbi:hypothetical protein M0805_005902 [Coniferiporia weirii]|nr:hypothetical protein M0805_005902 [Coniferiporia weirii]
MLPYYAAEKPYRTWLKPLLGYPRRHIRFCLVALVFISGIGLLWSAGLISSPVIVIQNSLHFTTKESDLPPLYEDWYELERNLPQHNESLPYPEGAQGRYFFASNHVWGLGFNNALQEQLFLSHLAYISNISFVFDVYKWNYVTEEPYSLYNGKLIPSRIPLGVFISGPTVGGPFGENDGTPRSVNKEFFQKVCPNPTLIKSDEVNEALGSSAGAKVMMEAWSKKLRETPARCIEVGQSSQIFDYMWAYGNRIVPFLEDFIKSPILTGFAWSPLINSALADNAHLFTKSLTSLQWLSSLGRDPQPAFNASDSSTPIPGLLAIHVRRGDFEEHCRNLGKWGSEFMGWLQSPVLQDRFDKPPLAGHGEPTQDIIDHYAKHCWPTIDEIVTKINEVRQTIAGKDLNRVYIMTNGASEWIAELKEKVLQSGWEGVASSKDLKLIPEQVYVAQAVDMAIAMRSQVFIGNGFSSLSGNVVVLRLSRHFGPSSNRLW